MGEILAEHRSILDKIRALYVKSGGEPLYKPEDFGRGTGKSNEGLEVSFDHGIPVDLYTPKGRYTILGSSVTGNCDEFWRLFCEAFNVETISPGLLVRITIKD